MRTRIVCVYTKVKSMLTRGFAHLMLRIVSENTLEHRRWQLKSNQAVEHVENLDCNSHWLVVIVTREHQYQIIS